MSHLIPARWESVNLEVFELLVELLINAMFNGVARVHRNHHNVPTSA